MPADFLKCEKDGGRIRTKSINDKQYIKICWPKGGGPSVSGEVHTKKKFLDGKV
jgi:hypothetical protein